MRLTTLFRLFIALGSTASLPLVTKAQAFGNDLVRIEVRVASDSDRKDLKGTTADTVTQNKILQIAISGKAKNPETRTAKWVAYGRDLQDKDITVLDSGEFKIDLSTGGQKFESKRVTTTSTPQHSVVSGRSGRRGRVNVKKVPAEGVKYIGYGVVVKEGDRVVGEAFDPIGLKQEAAK